MEADRGLREGLAAAAGPAANVFDEFLDAAPLRWRRIYRNHERLPARQIRHRAPDVIVAAGPDALAFCLQTRSRLFPGIPIVYLYVSQDNLAALGPLPVDVSGFPIVYDFSRTIEQALTWHPKARHLVVVTGTSPQDLEMGDRDCARYRVSVVVYGPNSCPACPLRR
ncbi:MAG: hypothetical protein IPK05_17095 [Comamonadaceae bacterium]|nr:hypothetical protein [Comamonadaceae bacterium]